MIWLFIKAIFFFSIAIALAIGFNLLKDSNGTLTIDFLSREYQLSFMAFFALILALLFAIFLINIAVKFLWSLIGFLRGDDTALKRFFERRSERKGQSFLISAYTASFEGDHERALLDLKRSKKYLKSKSLPDILSLSSYKAKGNLSKQEEIFQQLIRDKTTRSMGLFGLIKMKLSEGNTSLALKLTDRLIKLKPQNLSFNKTFFNLQLTEGDWDGALTTYKKINKIKKIDKEKYGKGESILLFQKAKELRSTGKTLDALKVSRQALKRFAGLVPNSILLSELELLEGQKKRAEAVLLSAWKAIPHPEIAKKFAEIENDESVEARIERFKKILNVKKSDTETKILKAELNILSENFPEARRAIIDLIEANKANAKVYTLMAAIEKGVGSSDAVVKGWLAKAVTAKRSKRWICSNCDSQSEWEPICKKCGAFSSLEWREERYENLETNDQSEILPLIIGENANIPDIQVDKAEIDVK
ncbi:hypothetical protein OA385_00635 [Paracoccaceae bacterium]|nr:hypothetical protein [Paracoccaceae bacterium]